MVCDTLGRSTMQLMKTHPFPKKPYDTSLFIRTIVGSEIETGSLTPASDVEIADFENVLGYQIPADYKEFLQKCNGGVIDPARASRYIGADIISTPNGNSFSEPNIGIDYFFTLDKASLLDAGEENYRESMVDMFYLPIAQNSYKDLDFDDLPTGLEHEKVIYFADGASYFWLLGCEGDFKNKVLVLDSNVDPDKPLDNVGIVADSFDEFMQSLYYEA